MTQTTISELSAVSWVKTLNATQQRIIKLLSTGDQTQSQVADRLGITRQYVCQFVKKLLKKGLLKERGDPYWLVRYWKQSKEGIVTPYRQECRTKADAEKFSKKVSKHSPEIEYQKSSTRYNIWYEVTPHLKKQVDEAAPDVKFTACRVHNIRLKYKITELSGPICTDHRTGYFSSWEMRGGTRYKFFIPGTAGKPDITIDVHPKTVVAYPDAGQTIYAESIDEAEIITTTAIHDAVLTFLKYQRLFDTKIEIKNPSLVGKLISKIHYGFEFLKSSPHAREQTDLEDFWIDNSPEKNGKAGYAEIETESKAAATALDRGIQTLSALGCENPLERIFQEISKLRKEVNHLVLMQETQAVIS